MRFGSAAALCLLGFVLAPAQRPTAPTPSLFRELPDQFARANPNLAKVVDLKEVPRDPETEQVVDWIARYDSGNRTEVADALARLPVAEFTAIAKTFEPAARSWIASGENSDLPRRRLLVATLALEIVNVDVREDWKTVRPLLEFGCELVRANPAGDAEHLWQRASVALFENAGDHQHALVHLDHAHGQFPNDPRFTFARAVVEEFAVAFDRWPRDRPWQTDSEIEHSAGPTGRNPFGGGAGTAELNRRAKVAAAAQNFLAFMTIPDLRSEAHLRIAHATLVLHEPARALEMLAQAEMETADPVLLYLARFFRGQALDMQGKSGEATVAYSQALAAMPTIQSGEVQLATHLFLAGQRDAAYTAAEQALAAPRSLDAWQLYAFGDYVRWPQWIAQLRAVIK